MTTTSPSSSEVQPTSTAVATTEKSPKNSNANPTTVPGRVETKRDGDNSKRNQKPDSKRTDDVKVEPKPV
jgi:hypothetical protein